MSLEFLKTLEKFKKYEKRDNFPNLESYLFYLRIIFNFSSGVRSINNLLHVLSDLRNP